MSCAGPLERTDDGADGQEDAGQRRGRDGDAGRPRVDGPGIDAHELRRVRVLRRRTHRPAVGRSRQEEM